MPGIQFRTIEETRLPGELPLFACEEWQSRFPWLFQATSGSGTTDDPFDLSFFGNARTTDVMDRWRAIRQKSGFQSVIHARQVHDANILTHSADPEGVLIAEDADGHSTTLRGVLLAVSVADCVPVFIVDENARSIVLLHAGWRGSAAGILEKGLRILQRTTYLGLDDVHVHFGPSICGDCYEVGPEVFAAMNLPAPQFSQPIDLRAALADRARAAGIRPANITISAHCTRCTDGSFFSHRRGDRERQMGLLGICRT